MRKGKVSVRGLLVSLFAATIVLTYMQSRNNRVYVVPRPQPPPQLHPQLHPQPIPEYDYVRNHDPKVYQVFSAIADVYIDLPVLLVDVDDLTPYARIHFNLSAVLLGGSTINPRVSECAITMRGQRWPWKRYIQMQFDTDIKGDIELTCNFPATVGIKLT